MEDELDLVSKLDESERAQAEFRLKSVGPDDGKYAEKVDPLRRYLSAEAEWLKCAKIQFVLLETREEFGFAKRRLVNEVDDAMEKLSPLNMALLEERVTRHDQLAVIEEIGRHISPEAKALLHPGTTSYDILDTARSSLFKEAWKKEIRDVVKTTVLKLCELGEKSLDVLQAGRTHNQHTSPVLLGGVLAGYAARIAERIGKCDQYFNDLRGKISGIVGTGASIEMIFGDRKGLMFEEKVLGYLDLRADTTASQVVQKERLVDVGHGLVSLMYVLGDLANNVRLMYSSEIGEVTSRDNEKRLGGSSADASKNNPINWENIAGKVAVVEGGMRVLYEMMDTDFQRDLRSSVQGRYQPQGMMTQVFESFSRANKALGQFSINEDRIAENLLKVRRSPSEAIVAILRGEGWVHSEHGVGHDFIKEMAKRARRDSQTLLQACLRDNEFGSCYDGLSQDKRDILSGELEKYTGFARERAESNIAYAREFVASKGN